MHMNQIFDLSVSQDLPLANVNNLKQPPCEKQGISFKSS